LHRPPRGFTLIELLVVMVIIATLLTLAVPRYFASVERSKEAVLKQSLRTMRDAIDKYYADNEKYPETLEALAAGRYLRSVPVDPVTGSAATWITVAPSPDRGANRTADGSRLADANPGADASRIAGARGGVYDVKSGAPGAASDGTAFAEW
jgi:general secretion pathway protein G